MPFQNVVIIKTAVADEEGFIHDIPVTTASYMRLLNT
jgi:hypothetical protein